MFFSLFQKLQKKVDLIRDRGSVIMDNNAPQTLELNEIDVKIEIPSQLQKPEFRFILVEHKRKKPKEQLKELHL